MKKRTTLSSTLSYLFTISSVISVSQESLHTTHHCPLIQMTLNWISGKDAGSIVMNLVCVIYNKKPADKFLCKSVRRNLWFEIWLFINNMVTCMVFSLRSADM